MIANRNAAEPDIVLVGAGIMSATLGTVLKELEPTLNIVLFETLHDCALESSEGWNNAGTRPYASQLSELNYTPQRPDGSVDISKALSRGQHRIRPIAPALVIPGHQGRDPRPGGVHQPVPAYELRLGRGQCRVPAPAL